MTTRSERTAGGFSLLELILATMLLSFMVLAVSTLSVSGAQGQEYAARLNRVTELNQDLVDRMRLELVSSVRQFGNDAEGNGNLALLDLAGLPAPLSGSLLPTIAPSASIRSDTAGNQITGNSVFFTKLAWTDHFVCTSTNEYLIDVYRWVYYYLTPVDGGPMPSRGFGLDLQRVLSEPMADASSIDRITDPTDQAEVLRHLYLASPDADGVTHPRCFVVWQRGGDPTATGTFRQIDSSYTLSDDPVEGRPDPWEILRDSVTPQSLLAYRHHSIATVYAQANSGVGRYSVLSTSGAGFPHGLEVQVVGPSSARQVLLHLVTTSTLRGRPAWSDLQVIVDARDL